MGLASALLGALGLSPAEISEGSFVGPSVQPRLSYQDDLSSFQDWSLLRNSHWHTDLTLYPGAYYDLLLNRGPSRC